MSPSFEIILIASVVASACALPGVFLILRRMSMMSDAISHTVLLGIVVAFLVVGELDNPLLIVGAAIVGVLTVSLTELISNSKLVKQDAAIGLVFPALFSLAVILISFYAGNVHLDEHTVFQGDLVFAIFDRFTRFGIDLPRTLVVMAGILLLNLAFILIFFKELKIATFDPQLAESLGISPKLIHYGLMTIVSITAVGAFDAVGSILVVALMIVPPTAAYLLTDRLPIMLIFSVLIGIMGAVTGYFLSSAINSTIGGSMVTMLGLIFGLVFLFAPNRGMVALASRRMRQKWEFAQAMLVIHLLNHEHSEDYNEEAQVGHLSDEVHWEPSFAERVVNLARRNELVELRQETLYLTDSGRLLAQQTLVT